MKLLPLWLFAILQYWPRIYALSFKVFELGNLKMVATGIIIYDTPQYYATL